MTIAETINYCTLSSPQKSIWFDQLRHANTPLYNIGGYVQIDGSVDQILFEEAINQVIQENNALRTVFGEGSILPVQFFDAAPNIELEYHDFSAQDDPHQQAIKWMESEISTPFQLYGQFLFKFALLKVSEKCYYWFVKYHHLIMDGWGNSLIFQRVSEKYTALVTGSALEEKARYSYHNFVQEDQEYLESSAYQRHKEYWQEKYRNLPEPLIPRRYASQFKGIVPSHRQTLTLKWAFYQQLIAFAKDHKVSTCHLILGALYCYFTRTHDRKEFAIGLPILNRNKAAFKHTIGLFTSVLPARFQFGTSLNFIELVQAISTELRKDYRHQRFPVDEINKLAGLHHSGQESLFDITLSYQKHDYLKTFAGNTAKFVTLSNDFEQMALAIAVEEYWENQDIRVTFDYNLAAFNDAEIELFKARFEHLLHEVLEQPTLPLWQLSLMPAAERHKVLVEFNDTIGPYPVNKTLVALFEEQVSNTPDSVAVVFEDQQLTYQELNDRANQLGRFLQMLGVKPEVLVGICIERSLDMMIGLLGILKAGGAYLPLDPNYPSERLAFMLDNSKAAVLLTQQKLMTSIAPALSRADMIQVIGLDKDRKMFSNMSTVNLDIRIQPDNLAYVIYTSGTTGKPKGVSAIHRGVVRLVIEPNYMNLSANEVFLQLAPLSFDASTLEIWGSLLHGAKLVIMPPHQPSLEELGRVLRQYQITSLWLTAGLFHLMVEERLEDLKSVRQILAGGDVLSVTHIQKVLQILEPDSRVINGYGPTENTTFTCCFPMTVSTFLEQTVPIGYPITSTQVYILDRYHNLTPIGVPGELYTGGDGLARGYFRHPELTIEKFIPNPFNKDHDSRLYKTGDLARYLPDGRIEFLGRIDTQVKIRGFRIELGEIEAILSQHPHVQETAVIVREEQPGDKRIVAYIVSDLLPKKIPYQSDCLVELEDGKILALRTQEISNYGVCLQQDKTAPLQEGQKVRLHLPLPGEAQERFWFHGQVVWSRVSWLGIELNLSSEAQNRLGRGFDALLEKEGFLTIVQRLLVGELRHCLDNQLPNYMVPAHFVLLSALPLTPNGKINRRALPAPRISQNLAGLETTALPQTGLENLIAEIWQNVLQIEAVGLHDHFFEIGGHSLLIVQVQSKLKERLDIDIPIVELFEHPTVQSLAKHLSQKNQGLILEQPQSAKKGHARQATGDLAIIGMATRLPGAKNVEEFWQNLQTGVESISFFEDNELQSAGIDSVTLNTPNYVKAGGILSDIDCFDAAFFDYSPKEAALMDPQHRLFLECAWEALENSGIEPGTDENKIGVYAGVGMNTYLMNNLYPNRQASNMAEDYQLMIGNSGDFLTSRVSYKLNLKGPSVNIQTACSTSLVAIHAACKRLLEGECDIALAGGVSIRVPQKTGYLYQEGMIMSPDGHCRAFDANAQGTVVSNGLGLVVLKKLEDAQADGDHIYAVIKGSAINNDGAVKVGYTAPSVEGQAKVISEAQTIAGVDVETISYIETHGTGTKLGDPIEMAALNQAFRAKTQKTGICAIGSVKTNIGHTDTAAGVTGLIKTSLALKHQALPPSLHFEQANPQIDFASSPFYVNTELTEWKRVNGTPRRAGVSSFGIGGTNAHVILEEAPEREPSGESRSSQLLVLSTKTESALESATANLATYLEQHSDVNLADVAYTLSKGRKTLSYRRAVIVQNVDEALTALRTPNLTLSSNEQSERERPVVFMFSGQGTQYVNMGLELYQTEPKFKEVVDECAEYLQPLLGLDLRQVLYPDLEWEGKISPNSSLKKKNTSREIPPNPPLIKGGIAKEGVNDAQTQINQTAIAQPALFVVEYALAKLWMSWGVYPEAMIGHSIGEYVAACISGVLSPENALTLVAARGQLMQQVSPGTMLAVSLSAQETEARLGEELSLAAINTPSLCVVSGPIAAVESLQQQLTPEGVECTRLHTSHAFHSKMMEPILGAFTEQVEQLGRCTPQIPYLSNVTGTWMTAEESVTSEYWVDHLRRTVRFSEGVQQLLQKPERIFLEIGPGRTLSSIAKRHPKAANQMVLSSLRHPQQSHSDVKFLLNTLGQLWQTGRQVDWSTFYANERRYRLPLPTYPFERQSYWVEAPKQSCQETPLDDFWSSIVTAAQQKAQPDISVLDNPTNRAKKAILDQVCVAYMGKAFQDLGTFRRSEDKYSFDELVTQFNIQPRYQQLLLRWLQVLVEHGQLQQQGKCFLNPQLLSSEKIQALVADFKIKWADEPYLFDRVNNCGNNLATILTGQQEPLALLFPGTDFELTESSVQESPLIQYYHAILQAIVPSMVKEFSQARHLNVIEIGGGTGFATQAILPMLPAELTRYIFTDVGNLFLKRAKQKFSDFPFMEYRPLNIEQSPLEQGYEPYGFELVVANNVLHVTRNMGETLTHVRSLLAPGGVLLIWEITQPQFDFDITDGLLMSQLEDGTRNQGNPFLSKQQWSQALKQHGFVEVAMLPETDFAGQHILVALADSETKTLTNSSSSVTQKPVDDKINQPTSTHTRPNLGYAYVAPRNKTEQQLVEIWQQFFEIEPVGIHDNFFDLGGDSLIAVQLLAKLRETVQTELSIHSLLNTPTVAALATVIDHSSLNIEVSEQSGLPNSSSLLVEIKKGNPTKTPLFLVHPAGGSVYFYRELAQHLDAEQPVYGIQAQGLDGNAKALTRIEEMAIHYLEAIRTVQPTGPYLLGGASLGGMVAFEMAQQLNTIGQQVALLAMIDTPGLGQMPVIQFTDDADILAYLFKMGANASISADELRQMETNEQLAVIQKMNQTHRVLPDWDMRQVRHFLHLFQANFQAMFDYAPQAYPGKVAFFRAKERDAFNPQNPEQAWIALVDGGIEIYNVPGNHITMNFTPHVQALAERMNSCLEKV